MAQKVSAYSSLSNVPKDVRLPFEKFPPSMWNDTFTSFSLDTQVQEMYAMEIEVLKEEVQKLLVDEKNRSLKEKLILIDNLECLGIAYHFKREIEEDLQKIFNFHSDDADCDLFTTALQFRLLRQHHYCVSSDTFHKFKGASENFDEKLSIDVKGLLSFYEATHMRTHGEHILEEGLAFTTYHLNLMAPNLSFPLQDHVKGALEHPLNRHFERAIARYYISFYEKAGMCNEAMLKLAKLDFNYVQNIYKKELLDLSTWWDKFDLKSKLVYTRDRVVEAYIWSVAMHSEPQDSFLRLTSSKCTLLTTVMDDTYDNYATVEEAQLFTQILQRWNASEIEQLPNYMKVVYEFILSTYEELLHEASKRERSFAVPYVREVIKELGRGYNQELKWFMGMQIPSFEDYTHNTILTSTIHILSISMLLGMNCALDQVFSWLLSNPKLVQGAAAIGRYRDDVASYDREGRGGQMLTAITIYMKHHDVSEQEALKKFEDMIEDAWRDINGDWVNLPANIPHGAANVIISFARISELVYKNSVDGFTNPEKRLATEIAGLFVDPLII